MRASISAPKIAWRRSVARALEVDRIAATGYAALGFFLVSVFSGATVVWNLRATAQRRWLRIAPAGAWGVLVSYRIS